MKKANESQDLRTGLCSYDGYTMEALASFLHEYGGFGRCVAYYGGRNLLRELASGQHFDVLILDEQMQDMDAVQFLEEYRMLHIKEEPLTMLLASQRFLFQSGRMLQQPADCCFVKPIHVGLLAQRALTFYNNEKKRRDIRCVELCRAWGVQEDTRNVAYMADAVAIVLAAGDQLAVRKEIILKVGEAHGVSISAVDSGLRRLIGEMEAADTAEYRAFKQAAGLETRRPTIKSLLCAIKWYLTARESSINDRQNEWAAQGDGQTLPV